MRKRNRYRALSAFLAAGLLVQQSHMITLAAEVEESRSVVHIASEEELQVLADKCKNESFSQGKTFYLEADLDLTEYENLFIPVMDGIFEGNGHEIIGLTLDEEMSDYGLFRYIGVHGVVRGLTVEADVTGGDDQENIGILAGNNSGEISGCTSRGTINGQLCTGGIAGYNKESGQILRSQNEAQVDGKNHTGGIAGENKGIISNSSNTGNINTNQKVKKTPDGEGSVNISIPGAVTGLTKDERAADTGGIAGVSSGSITHCKNEGVIGYKHLGSSTGGIVGRQKGSLAWCENSGTVYGRKEVGGIAGYFEAYEATSYDRDYREELGKDLDDLSAAFDSLQDAADRMGDHLSGNMDVLENRLKAFRDSVRGYVEYYGDELDDNRDDLHDQMDGVKEAIDEMQFNAGMEKLNAHMQKLSYDISKMMEILGQIAKLPGTTDVVSGYQEQAEKLQETFGELEEAVKELEEEHASGDSGETAPAPDHAEEEAEPAPGNAEEGGANPDNTDAEDVPAAEEPDEVESADAREAAGNAAAQGAAGNTDAQEEAAEVQQVEPVERMAAVSYAPVRVMLASSNVQGAAQDTGNEDDAETPPGDSPGGDPVSMLQVLVQDAQQQVQGIMGVVSGLSAQTSDGMKKLSRKLGKIEDSLHDDLDGLSDDLGQTKTDLRNQGNSISDSLEGIGDTLDSDIDIVFDRITEVKNEFTGIRGTISDGLDELKSRVEDQTVYVDVSRLADNGMGEGKIISCENSGEIYADSLGGGIAGCISKENAVDKGVSNWFVSQEEEEDEEDDGKDTITKHVQAAIIDCVNVSQVSMTGDYGGGIVGKADYGVVRVCENYADVLSDDGAYIGGIAGLSEQSITDCYVLAALGGEAYVGGVAGRAEEISGSYVCSYLELDESFAKCSGAVAGKADGLLENNYFVDNGYGAVDGVTREAEAAAVDYKGMLSLKDLPDNFKNFTVRFKDGEEVVWEKNFTYGASLAEADYPELSAPESGYAYWEKKNLDFINRNITLHAVYRAYIPSLVSNLGEDRPEILLGGQFYPDTTFSVREADDSEKKQVREQLKSSDLLGRFRVMQVYCYDISQKENLNSQISLRVLNRYHGDRIAVISANMEVVNEVQKAPAEGRYMAANVTVPQNGYLVVIHTVNETLIAIGAVIALAALAAGACFLRRYRKKKKEATEEDEKKAAEENEKEAAEEE